MKVIIIDEIASKRQNLEAFLSGLKVIFFTGCLEEAMEYMSRNTADLVIIDPVLPGFPNAMAVPKSLSKPDEKARKIQRKFPQENHGEKTDSLSEREIEILGLLYQGHAKQSIADELCLSYHTVKTHTTNIYRKLNVHTRSAAVYKYFHEAG